jgi:hypothetical protein
MEGPDGSILGTPNRTVTQRLAFTPPFVGPAEA